MNTLMDIGLYILISAVFHLILLGWIDSVKIITVPGYEHAVAILDDCEYSQKVHLTGGVMYCEDGISYTVNTGHENDPEIEELKTAARTQK